MHLLRQAAEPGRTLLRRLRNLRTPRDFIVVGLLVLLVLFGVEGTLWLARYAIAVNELSRATGETVFYSADGQPWFPLEEHRRDVPLGRVSLHFQHAVIAVEDHRFYSHPGVDLIAMARAGIRNASAGGIIEGGSTLTQQLARTLFLSNSRSYGRKLKEIVLALMIERQLSKRQILELYLNRIYLGRKIYGVEAMSRNLFGKGAADLTLAESAFIAGLIRMPSSLSPWSHFDSAVRRSHVVLARMRELGLISAAAERDARAAVIQIQPAPALTTGGSGYAQEFLRQQFRDQFGDQNPPGWKVQTSFLPTVQAEAERAVRNGLRRLNVSDLQAALVALDPQTGNVLALVGGRDFGRAPFNRAVRARRQSGSAFKPFLYAAALESGLSPVSLLSGLAELRILGHDEWVVRNANGGMRDELTLREALLESNNQAAVRLQQQIGSKPVLRLARALGLQNLPDVPSLALGTGESTPLELTTAYATFANGGIAVMPRAMLRVTAADGSVVFDSPIKRQRVLSDGTAFQMVTMLREVLDQGTASAARQLGVRFPAAGKTGTTDDFKDAWFVGFSSSVAAGVWVGFDQPAPIALDAYGSRYALPIWAEFMTRIATLRPPEEFRVPSSVHEELLCQVTQLRAAEGCPGYREFFKPGDVVPEAVCPLHRGGSVARLLGSFGHRLRDIFRH